MKRKLKRKRWRKGNRSWKQYWRRRKGDAAVAGDYDWEWLLNTDEVVVDWEKDTDGNLVEDFAVEGVGVVVERRRALLKRTKRRSKKRKRWRKRKKAKRRKAARQRRTQSP